MLQWKFYISLILLTILSCKSKNEFSLEMRNGFSIDTSYHFTDSKNNKILYKIYSGPDQDNFITTWLTFRHYFKYENTWEIQKQYDSIVIQDYFNPLHDDINGDGIMDFVFLAKQGIRGANFYTNLLLYDRTLNTFTHIKGFENVCSPFFDKESNMTESIKLSGNKAISNFYIIKTDTFYYVRNEVWENDSLLSKDSAY